MTTPTLTTIEWHWLEHVITGRRGLQDFWAGPTSTPPPRYVCICTSDAGEFWCAQPATNEAGWCTECVDSGVCTVSRARFAQHYPNVQPLLKVLATTPTTERLALLMLWKEQYMSPTKENT